MIDRRCRSPVIGEIGTGRRKRGEKVRVGRGEKN
tara:strand:+ start:111 stop:212 length:102 start_codon:yes stop_codon:yes gene_type:complete